jgi:hypothetical protein
VTLLVSILNRDYVILLADRRITRRGQVISDSYNKLTVLCCHDARVAISFTGLAKAGAFDTCEWIMAYLNRAGESDDRFETIFEGMRTELEPEMKRLNLSQHLLTILVAGFLHSEVKSEPVCLTITNVNEDGTVTGAFRSKKTTCDGKGFAVFAGMDAAVTPKIKSTIDAMANSAIDRRHVGRKAVITLQRAAESHSALNTIGQHCSSAVIFAEPDTTIATTYHVPNADRIVFGPNFVVTKGIYSYGIELRAEEMLAGSEIAKRAPCWCGSGVRFKYCHMKKFGSVYVKFPGFKQPLTWVTKIDVEARPSGTRFCVAGGIE